ncbi:uncharacterized protein FRV6_11798 [Fusarium oxysporum]|uniref:Uncharacterized protein n=1 Tax=Fusarium oxysporum TaxID=5507 RepID=A0A2H3TPM4_FUSOX|nr:uncharacterized protein FRV6_11798 [Fusarium oxysporum]
MSSIQKLVYHWKQGQFIPGGKPPQPLNNEVKGQRLSELNGDDMIALEITKGISILKDAVESFKKTQEFNRDPNSFMGDARDVLMSDEFLLVADVLRLIFPEGMISEVWQLKRGRDEDLDTGNRPILIPKSKKRRLDVRGEQEESMNSERGASKAWAFGSEGSRNRRGHKAGGIFGIPASQVGFKNRPEAQQHKTGGLFGTPASQLGFTNRPEALQEHKTGGLFGTPASQLGFTNGPETQEPTSPLSSVLPGQEKGSNNSPALQHTGIFGAKSPTPEYTGIFSQRMGFASENPIYPVVSEGIEKVSYTSPSPQHTGAKSSKPQTGGIFSTTSPGLEHTGSSSQPIGSLSGNKEEAIVDNLLSSMGADDVNKILAQLQLRQQGIKRKHEKEEETTNKKQINTQEPHSLI